MKINNQGISNVPVPVKEPVQESSVIGREGAPDSARQLADLYVPSQEWTRVQSLLNQQPEIRNDRVALAMERLRSGYYMSGESAATTAAAMMSSRD